MRKVLRLDQRRFLILQNEICQMEILWGAALAHYKALEAMGLDVASLPSGTKVRIEVVPTMPAVVVALEDDEDPSPKRGGLHAVQ
jgi:hypothetical protein